jgi:UDPglucose 6-dehydrogenase
MDNTKALLEGNPNIAFTEDNYIALEGSDALVLLTEWPQFRKPDFDKIRELLKKPVIFDGRNQYNPDLLRKKGFTYYGIGRNS